MIIIIITSCDFSCESNSVCGYKIAANLRLFNDGRETCYLSSSPSAYSPSSSSFRFSIVGSPVNALDFYVPEHDHCTNSQMKSTKREVRKNCTHTPSTERASATCGLVGYLFDGWMSIRVLGSEFGSCALRLISTANCENAFKWKTPCLTVTNLTISHE